MDQQSLLTDIEAFCATHHLSHAKFGTLALNDWRFVQDLQGKNRSRARRVWPDTEREVRRFMATYRSDDASSARAA